MKRKSKPGAGLAIQTEGDTFQRAASRYANFNKKNQEKKQRTREKYLRKMRGK